MPSYVFKDGPVRLLNGKDADAQALGEATEGASRAIERKIKAGLKLDEADALTRLIHAEVVRDGAKNPFHKHLEWNDKRGAYLHRLSQIGAIIRVIRVVDATSGDVRPAFISIRAPDAEATAYRPAQTIITNVALQIATLRRAEADLSAFRARYRMLADICQGALDLEERVRARRETLIREGTAEGAAA